MKREVELRELGDKQLKKRIGLNIPSVDLHGFEKQLFQYFNNRLYCGIKSFESVMSGLYFEGFVEKEVVPFVNSIFKNRDIRGLVTEENDLDDYGKYYGVFEFDGKFYLNEQDYKELDFMHLKEFKERFEKGIEYDSGKELKEYLKITETGDEDNEL